MMLRLQFFAALVVAAVWHVWDSARGVKRAMMAREEQVDTKLSEARMSACRECPVFRKRLATCGSPFGPKDHTGKPMGCFCHMPTKSRTKTNCWAYDNGISAFGWPADLNSFP